MTEDELKYRAPRRHQVLTYVKAEIAAGRPFPSFKQIATAMSWASESQARDVINALVICGYIGRRRAERGIKPYYVYWLKEPDEVAA